MALRWLFIPILISVSEVYSEPIYAYTGNENREIYERVIDTELGPMYQNCWRVKGKYSHGHNRNKETCYNASPKVSIKTGISIIVEVETVREIIKRMGVK